MSLTPFLVSILTEPELRDQLVHLERENRQLRASVEILTHRVAAAEAATARAWQAALPPMRRPPIACG